jgi:hypothetical protein
MSAPKDDEEADLTTAVGLFHYAESYWLSGRALEAKRVDCTHPDAPVSFLYYHAIELLLKAYLRQQGMSPREMASKGYSHQTGALARQAEKLGLRLTEGVKEVVLLMEKTDAVIRSRYIKTGGLRRPRHDALDPTCESLRETVGQALRDAGHPIRRLPRTNGGAVAPLRLAIDGLPCSAKAGER